ncbi:MAG TPA: polysaccharide biosynthesis protein [Candidatus Fermentibacter daniensis]|jgi:UDP-glucose 4-epimerase|nr:MAG: polysaccharide biosynthesis protein [Candidatus Fermentibacter daniensis]NLI02292.1 polysaccharide biosynthesis protein [Candidatus Fermentibacter daniensis]HOA04375.1 polysaccharide biosynthesis protein [Candidatus Fermentibacter daniensis]HOD20548.1 polysaccharide biosynthesis protein [Candidatus Fermentibacter daniensis]HOF66699.1 polysaccharide biosynthesis protein [Candidatus Fermentibacter daniensis]
MGCLEGKRLLVTGGTGSLGQVLVRRLLSGEMGTPAAVVVFSRDEAKQHFMRMNYANAGAATDEIIYDNSRRILEFRIGDVRDFHSVASALKGVDVVFNAAALKQVPTCEYFPFEAVRTNIEGPENIVRAIQELGLPVGTVVGISTDKACKPVNVMGMTKAIQERVFQQANMRCPSTRFVCVRYGNVLASRGSVIPLFLEQIRTGGPVTITTRDMTRFLLSLDDAVDTVFAAVKEALPGETWIPRAPSARMVDLAEILIGDRSIGMVTTGIRPGEKIHEILVSEEEAFRTCVKSDRFYAIGSILPEVRRGAEGGELIGREYSSAGSLIGRDALGALLSRNGLMPDQVDTAGGELLR